MTLFVDASAMLAILLDEPDKPLVAARLDQDEDRIWSPIARWETVANMARARRYDIGQAELEVDEVASLLDLRLISIGEREGRLAMGAFDAFGKSRHPAGLNMGDCFAYACARTNNARLLYKGNDFSQTDMAWPDA